MSQPHTPGATLGPIDDPSIPVLTDRIFLPAIDLDTALPPSPPPAAPVESDDVDSMTPAVTAGLPAEAGVELPPAVAVEAEPAGAEADLPEQEPALEHDEAESPESAQDFADQAPREATAAGAPPADPEEALTARAEALRTAVLQRVTDRLHEQVDTAVRDLMRPAIDQAMARLGEEAQLALRITLQDLVEQALREELARHGDDAPRR
jgi:hypothetical protein